MMNVQGIRNLFLHYEVEVLWKPNNTTMFVLFPELCHSDVEILQLTLTLYYNTSSPAKLIQYIDFLVSKLHYIKFFIPCVVACIALGPTT